jgi:serine/threonine protein kinase
MDRYVVGHLLGRGRMGTVYVAADTATGRSIALKLMHPDVADDPKALRRFEREAEAGRTIASDHVASVLDSGIDSASGRPWLTQELVEGESLDSHLDANPDLDRETALEMLRQIFRGAAAAHRARVVHRDLKPDNILVSHRTDGRLHMKILDFGVAKSMSTATALDTQAGQGTPMWVAPEQSEGEAARPCADVWALGLIAFYVLTGKVYWRSAHTSASPFDLVIELLQEPLEPASVRAAFLGVADRLPPGFDDWFARAVQRVANQRFVDAQAARAELIRIVDERREQRHAFWLPVEASGLPGGIAMSHDVSEGGLLLVAKGPVAPDTELELLVRVPGVASPYAVRAKALRSSSNDADPDGLWPFRIAVAFTTPAPELAAALAYRDSPAKSRRKR